MTIHKFKTKKRRIDPRRKRNLSKFDKSSRNTGLVKKDSLKLASLEMRCTKCQKQVFHIERSRCASLKASSRSSTGQVCQCQSEYPVSFGTFWQSYIPHMEAIETVACYRSKQYPTQWTRVRMPTSQGSSSKQKREKQNDVHMKVKMADEKIRIKFSPQEVEIRDQQNLRRYSAVRRPAAQTAALKIQSQSAAGYGSFPERRRKKKYAERPVSMEIVCSKCRAPVFLKKGKVCRCQEDQPVSRGAFWQAQSLSKNEVKTIALFKAPDAPTQKVRVVSLSETERHSESEGGVHLTVKLMDQKIRIKFRPNDVEVQDKDNLRLSQDDRRKTGH